MTHKQIEAAAIALLIHDEGEDAAHWAKQYIENNQNVVHEGDCPFVEKPAPFTCIRCSVDSYFRDAKSILEAGGCS